MVKFLTELVTGNTNERELRRLRRLVDRINALEPEVERLSDPELAGRTPEFRQRLANGEGLDDILPEAFAVVREAARRSLGLRHFDVQLMGGIVLHEGNIAEMKTGEGKTLVATLAAYVNALPGEGVHIVTVNDYLARRDAEWMGPIYRMLGLTVGVVVHGLDFAERRAAYLADITYGTNSECGFDYLRDNMALSLNEVVQRPLNYAIVDEVDSILIDEARTPLIISGPGPRPSDLYYRFARVVRYLREGEDYQVDEKAHSVAPTEQGVAKAEKLAGVKNLYAEGTDLSHYLVNALKAHALMKRDRDYVVKDGQVIIVDEFTGRLMFGRRYSDGLHQAIEAKEGLRIQRENQTIASITLQNYFRMYRKLAGMTGTAFTEAEEFRKIYGMDVVVIPTHKPMIRADHADVVYKTERAKFEAVANEIEECYRGGQPVLVGTISIEKSERLSDMLKRRGIPHQVLNAKHHEKEAQIIARAGHKGQVTIATNMAGRGVDIVLGEGVVDLGGLHIVGTERHEARRIDNQLRGRSGRQGDPGSSRFYLSLEDDLMRLFGGEMISGIMDRLRIPEDEAIDHPMISRAIERAQKRVEAHNFEIRRRVLQYDDVMNKQREIIYRQRRQVLEGVDLRDQVMEMVGEVVDELVGTFVPERVHPEEWDLEGLAAQLASRLGLAGLELEGRSREELVDYVLGEAEALYARIEEAVATERMREFERLVLLRVVDYHWMDHLAAMDDLREGIGLRAYAQKDPLIEYQLEAFEMFNGMIHSIRSQVVSILFRAGLEQVQVARAGAAAVGVAGAAAAGGGATSGGRRAMQAAGAVAVGGAAAGGRSAAGSGHAATAGSVGGGTAPVRGGSGRGGLPPGNLPSKVGRNDPCPCGSGKKYKKCCGRTA
ncbi:MAG: preprotein translocase subunit SecA [Bacillota bacterium]|nr:preprotein translocase subunit SecA [Bacillota bacterium]